MYGTGPVTLSRGPLSDMRIVGLVLVAVGALSVLTRVATIFILVGRGAPGGHAMSKAAGGLAFGALILAVGLGILRRSRDAS